MLLKEILNQTTIPRIRISSLGPEYLNDEFFEVIRDSRVLPHFHLSIQSFSDAVLKGMKRNYSAEHLKNVLKRFNILQSDCPKGPSHATLAMTTGVSLGADIIVGFPGESEQDFEETVLGIREFNITKVHGFPFSEHAKGEMVPASLFEGQLSRTIKIQRVKKLLEVADEVRKAYIQKHV